jgi:hypothetical protein
MGRSSSTTDGGAQISVALPDLLDGFVTGLLELFRGSLEFRAGSLQRSTAQESIENRQLEPENRAKGWCASVKCVGAETRPFHAITNIRKRIYLGEIRCLGCFDLIFGGSDLGQGND